MKIGDKVFINPNLNGFSFGDRIPQFKGIITEYDSINERYIVDWADGMVTPEFEHHLVLCIEPNDLLKDIL